MATKHIHRYATEDRQLPLQECIECGALVTRPGSIQIFACDNVGHELGTSLTQLDTDGVLLPDAAGHIAAGFHAGTSCAMCGAPLDDLEVFLQ